MKKNTIAWMLACALLLLTACGSVPSAEKPAAEAAQQPTEAAQETDRSAEAENSTEESAVEDGQNPVMNFIGFYRADRASILVEAEGKDGAKFTVTWGSSYNERSEWIMSGTLDTDTLTVAYDNCVRTDCVFADDGSVKSTTVVYENGSGRIVFDGESYALTWEDGQEHMADGMTFIGGLPEEEPEETASEAADPDYYAGVTAMDREAVEEIAATVRDAYLNEDWAALTNMIRYPITINGTELRDADAFLSYMSDKTVHESDRASMTEESCRDMFYNGQGICLGSGSIWLLDPGYMTEEDSRLEIIAISGIVNK